MRKTSRSKWSREMWVRNTEADVRGQTGWLLLWQFAPTKRTETCFKPGCLVCHWLFMGSQKAENGERMAPCYSRRQVLPVIWESPGLGQVLPVHPSISPPQHPFSLQPGYAIDVLMIPFWRADHLKSSMELAACKGVSIAHFLSSPATQFRFSSLWDMSWCFSLSEDPKTLCWSSFWWPSSCSGLLKEFLGLIRLHWIYSN